MYSTFGLTLRLEALGHIPFTDTTRVQNPVGVAIFLQNHPIMFYNTCK